MLDSDRAANSIIAHYDNLRKLPGIEVAKITKVTELELPIAEAYTNFLSTNSDFFLNFTDYFMVWTRVDLLIKLFVTSAAYDIAGDITEGIVHRVHRLEAEEDCLQFFTPSKKFIESEVNTYFDNFKEKMKIAYPVDKPKITCSLYNSNNLGKFIFSRLRFESKVFTFIGEKETSLISALELILLSTGELHQEEDDSTFLFELKGNPKLSKKLSKFDKKLKAGHGILFWKKLFSKLEDRSHSLFYAARSSHYLFIGKISSSSELRSSLLSDWMTPLSAFLNGVKKLSIEERDQIGLMLLQDSIAQVPFLKNKRTTLKMYSKVLVEKLNESLNETEIAVDQIHEVDNQWGKDMLFLKKLFKRRGKIIIERFITGMLSQDR